MNATLQVSRITNEVSKNIRTVMGNKRYKIILYGSYARGDYDNESDIDMMIVADIGKDEKVILQKAVDKISSNLSLQNDVTVCILLKERHFFDAHRSLPFYKNVISEGIEVYGSQ